jgi:hypothetical protein
MAYKNYEDGEYLVDGERITVKNGASMLLCRIRTISRAVSW